MRKPKEDLGSLLSSSSSTSDPSHHLKLDISSLSSHLISSFSCGRGRRQWPGGNSWGSSLPSLPLDLSCIPVPFCTFLFPPFLSSPLTHTYLHFSLIIHSSFPFPLPPMLFITHHIGWIPSRQTKRHAFWGGGPFPSPFFPLSPF